MGVDVDAAGHRRPHDLDRRRLADAGGVVVDEGALEQTDLLVGEHDLGELADPGVGAVHDLVGGELFFEHGAAHADALQRLAGRARPARRRGRCARGSRSQRPAIKRDRHRALLPFAARDTRRRPLYVVDYRRWGPAQPQRSRARAGCDARRGDRCVHRCRQNRTVGKGVSRRLRAARRRRTDHQEVEPMRILTRRWTGRAALAVCLFVAGAHRRLRQLVDFRLDEPDAERLDERLAHGGDHERLADVLLRRDAGGDQDHAPAERPAVRDRDPGAGELGDRQGDDGQGDGGHGHLPDHRRRDLLDPAGRAGGATESEGTGRARGRRLEGLGAELPGPARAGAGTARAPRLPRRRDRERPGAPDGTS